MPADAHVRYVTRSRRHLARVALGTRRYRHDDHIISLHAVEGGRISLGDEHLSVTGPVFCLLPAGDLDDNAMHGHDDAWWCAFVGGSVASVAGGVRLEHDGIALTRPRAHVVAAGQARQAATLFRGLQTALAAEGLIGRLRAQARLADLLALWVESGTPAQADDLSRLHDLIDETACDPRQGIDGLARRLGRHPDTLTAGFRRRFGCTPVAYRTQVRLQRARELLAGGEDGGVAEVARVCGFDDPGYFRRVFLRHVGLTPGDWVRRFVADDDAPA